METANRKDVCCVCGSPGATYICSCEDLPLHTTCIGIHIDAESKKPHSVLPLVFHKIDDKILENVKVLSSGVS
jgi:hypothetical protein